VALDAQRLNVHHELGIVAFVMMVFSRGPAANLARVRVGLGEASFRDRVIDYRSRAALGAVPCLKGAYLCLAIGAGLVGRQPFAILRRIAVASPRHKIAPLGLTPLVTPLTGRLAGFAGTVGRSGARGIADTAHLTPARQAIARGGLAVEAIHRLRLAFGGAVGVWAPFQAACEEGVVLGA
jgi:hypothetical protein